MKFLMKTFLEFLKEKNKLVKSFLVEILKELMKFLG